MCQALLSCGAVISMQNNAGDTPIDVVLSVFKDATLPAQKRVGLRECFLLLMKYRCVRVRVCVCACVCVCVCV